MSVISMDQGIVSIRRCLSHNALTSPLKQTAELDIWTLIASQSKKEDDSTAPYIHPMLKRSASALSHRSLQVCTESLGSETGSDDFSSLQSQEDRPQQQQQQQQQQNIDFDYEDVKVAKYNFAALGRKLPPPLPCLSSQCDRPSVRMKPRREDGRLVLEAVSVSAHNNFKAERQHGRLLLTFANPQHHQEPNNQEEEANATEEYSIEGNEIEMATPKTSSGMIELHRLALRSPSILAGINNPTCPRHFKLEGEEEIVRTPDAESLNAYDYCWRAKPTAAQAMEKNRNSKHVITKNNSSIIADQKQKQSAITYLKGCKEHRRSLFWEPYCIATS